MKTDIDNSTEIWKDIPSFEGVYQVSNFGNVKRLSYTKILYNGGSCTIKERLLKSSSKTRPCVQLQNEGHAKRVSVNRLVYSLFNNVLIQNNHIITHKDGNKFNCRLDNLKLITKRVYFSRNINKIGYTGVHKNKDKFYCAKIAFECVGINLHVSKDIEECNKIYQAAKQCFEEYDRLKTEILSNSAKNRLINKSVKL